MAYNKWASLAREALPLDARLRPGFDRSWRALGILGAVILFLIACWSSPDLAGGLGGLAGLLAPACQVLAAAAAVVLCLTRPTLAGTAWPAVAIGLTLWAVAGLWGVPMAGTWLPGGASTGSLLSIAASVSCTAAVGVMSRRCRLRLEVTALADGLLVVACGFTLAGFFLFEPLVASGASSLLVLEAISGLLLYAALVGFRYAVVGPLSPAQAATLTGLLAVLLGEGWRLRVVALGSDAAVAPLVPGLLTIAAGLLFLLAVYRTVMPPALQSTANRWQVVAPWMPMGYLGLVVLLPVVNYAGRRLSEPVLLGVITSLTLLVIRFGISLRENNYLRAEHRRLLRQNEEYARLAVSDPLTGLFNKGYFESRLKAETERGRRYGQPLSLVTLDLDNFKGVNDRYGHAAGDALLTDIGRALRSACRSVDIACRCGGDEFVVILPHTHIEAALIAAERMRTAVIGALERRGLSPNVGVSAGVAALVETADSVRDLLARADGALYEAKHTGKGRTAVAELATAMPPDLAC